MQVEERRACPLCSADDPSDAEFCWQCYARFVPISSEAVVASYEGTHA